ncbi:hypothetical protein CapIbe_010258 [Capra ibex]
MKGVEEKDRKESLTTFPYNMKPFHMTPVFSSPNKTFQVAAQTKSLCLGVLGTPQTLDGFKTEVWRAALIVVEPKRRRGKGSWYTPVY